MKDDELIAEPPGGGSPLEVAALRAAVERACAGSAFLGAKLAAAGAGCSAPGFPGDGLQIARVFNVSLDEVFQYSDNQPDSQSDSQESTS